VGQVKWVQRVYTKRLKYLQNVYYTVSREKTVRVSEEELQQLKKYRDENYHAYVPLGFVIGQLINEN